MHTDPWWHKNEIYAPVAAAALLLAGLFVPGTLVAKLLIVFVLLHASWTLGRQLIHSSGIRGYGLGLLTILASQSLFQTIFYYGWLHLGAATDAFSLAGAIVFLQIALTIFPKPEEEPKSFEQETSFSWSKDFVPPLLSLLGGAILFFILMKYAGSVATFSAIRTPWPLLPEGTFLAIALLPVTAWMAFRSKKGRMSGILLSIFILLSITLLAPLIYKLGYGFDGFLHQASERVLLETGTLNPKPLYYIGQYVFVTWLARLFDVSFTSIDRFLVPISALLILVSTSFVFREKKPCALLFLPLLLPLGAFVTTTPQSFAYVLGLVALGLALATQSRALSILPALLFAVWSLATHPLAGLPFVGATVLILIAQKETQSGVAEFIKKILLGLLVFFTSASVPLAFYLQDMLSGHTGNWQWQSLNWQSLGTSVLAALTPPINHVALWADWATYTEFFLPFILVLLAALAIWKGRERRESSVLLTLTAVGLTAAGLLLKTVGDFSFLIDYERGNYADRLFLVAMLLLLFPALEGASVMLKHMRAEKGLKAAWIPLILALWFVGHAHAALPRYDASTASRGWSVSLADYDAVRAIEQDADGQPYTVLANQSVSAAAVDRFGFRRYVHDASTQEDIFYYPLPTGGRLYQLFLEAVASNPSIDAIHEAAHLGQTQLLYVVVNAYWWDANHVSEVLKQASEKEFIIQDGNVKIYRFNVKQ
ncbi:hypothetical protein COX00_00890 [Candidatus Uhrbacteria bacterium CG22_combo_CG10-13_8_21_14_all_47_17]|uniref:Glycosyltransferase RgtA/B/C/D-like domain-containing protein n=1 Tax=Candidatus Uhrbacteria bacterium CG22_combo_CG10-13_8_21_14_all_47_17 TaxID=1975041 RepID=A0A2H0BT92_9BACT|nr:MAG: hypothetical protein COX00_00890 [Candidatus Uhrbacteria bacterium CG22_combo_CG10-13_8_21_14_all_47_17]